MGGFTPGVSSLLLSMLFSAMLRSGFI